MRHARGRYEGARRVIFLMACWIVQIVPASGQTALTLEQCVVLAKEHNLQLSISNAGIRSASLSRSEFQSAGLPRFTMKMGSSIAPASPSFGYDPIVSNRGVLSAQLGVEHTLYDGSRGLRLDQLDLGMERSSLEYRMAERDLVYAVRVSFNDVLRGQRETDLLVESVTQLADYLGIAERMVRGGSGTSTDILKTRIQLANAQNALEVSRAATAQAKLALSDLTGGPIDTSFVAVGSLDRLIGNADSSGEEAPPDPALSLESRASDVEIRKAALDVDIVRRERYPLLSFSGDVGYLSSIENLQLPPEERFNAVGAMAGITLEVPILNWGGTGLRTEERELALDTLRMQANLLLRSIRSSVSKTVLQLASARSRLKLIRLNSRDANDNYLLTMSRYVGGGALSLEVLSAQQLLSDTRLAEIEALSEIQSLLARLDQLSTQ